jgi:HEAT repeat protein
MSRTLTRDEQDALLDALASGSEEVRRLAVEQLLLLPASEAVPQLLARLGDPAWRVRKAAIDRLVTCRDDALVHPGLIAALADGENPGRRNAAFEALVAMGQRAMAPLIEAAGSPDVDVRKLAVDALAAIGDPGAREMLVRTLADSDANVRAAAADALGVVGGLVCVGALVRTSTDRAEVPLVRLSALRSLDRLEVSVGAESLADALAHPQLRPAALDLLGHSTDPQAEAELVKGLANAARSIRESSIGALLRRSSLLDGAEAEALYARLRERARADADLVARCCDGLEGEELSRRTALVQFLGVVADERAILPLLQAGRDESLRELVDSTLVGLEEITVAALRPVWNGLDTDLEVRACAILGGIGGEAAEDLLVATLRGSSARAISSAAKALGEGGFYRCMPELVGRLEAAAREGDPDRADEIEELIAAIAAMAERAQFADGEVHVQLIEVLASRLGGAPEPLRVAIARVLARIGRPEDAELIDYLAKDASPLVRRAAVQALARFDPDRTRAAMRLALGDESGGVRIAAAAVLGRSASREALADLERLARDGDGRVAAAAVRAVGELLDGWGDRSAGDGAWLRGAVEREPIVALAAVETLARIGGPIVVEAGSLALARSEPDIVRAAIQCLGRHAASDQLVPIVALVAHEDWTVRAEAVKVLAARGVRRSLPAMLRRLEAESDAFVRESILSAARKLEP